MFGGHGRYGGEMRRCGVASRKRASGYLKVIHVRGFGTNKLIGLQAYTTMYLTSDNTTGTALPLVSLVVPKR